MPCQAFLISEGVYFPSKAKQYLFILFNYICMRKKSETRGILRLREKKKAFSHLKCRLCSWLDILCCLSVKRDPWEIIAHLMESQCPARSAGRGRLAGCGLGDRGEMAEALPLRIRSTMCSNSSPTFVQVRGVLPCVTHTFPSLIISVCIQECLTL